MAEDASSTSNAMTIASLKRSERSLRWDSPTLASYLLLPTPISPLKRRNEGWNFKKENASGAKPSDSLLHMTLQPLSSYIVPSHGTRKGLQIEAP